MARDVVQASVHFFPWHLLIGDHLLCESADDGQRCAEFVRDVGEECGAHVVDLAQNVSRLRALSQHVIQGAAEEYEQDGDHAGDNQHELVRLQPVLLLLDGVVFLRHAELCGVAACQVVGLFVVERVLQTHRAGHVLQRLCRVREFRQIGHLFACLHHDHFESDGFCHVVAAFQACKGILTPPHLLVEQAQLLVGDAERRALRLLFQQGNGLPVELLGILEVALRRVGVAHLRQPAAHFDGVALVFVQFVGPAAVVERAVVLLQLHVHLRCDAVSDG